MELVCFDCRGSGELWEGGTCPACRGVGTRNLSDDDIYDLVVSASTAPSDLLSLGAETIAASVMEVYGLPAQEAAKVATAILGVAARSIPDGRES